MPLVPCRECKQDVGPEAVSCPHCKAPYPGEPVKTIGIALSGGGHRATVFSLGALLYLVDAGLHRNVRTVASVSGGSLTNAVLSLLGSPFCRASAAEFDASAAELARRIAGSPSWWWLSWAVYLITALILLPVSLSFLPAVDWKIRLPAFLGAVAALAIFVGPRSGGTLWAWVGTWLYVWLMIPALGGVVLLWWLPVHWAWQVLATAGWALALGQRSRVAEMAFARFLHATERGRQERKRAIPLEDMHPEVEHIFCATEMHAGNHAYFARDFVYADGFGIGKSARLPLSRAVQVSAAFPGGFPVRPLRAVRHGFTLGDKEETAWMVLSDGGVFNNLADAWHMESRQRSLSLKGRLDALQTKALRPFQDRMDQALASEASSAYEKSKQEYWRKQQQLWKEHECFSERIEHWDRPPAQLIVVNASVPFRWQGMGRVWIPLLGEALGFIKVTNVMYNNGTSARGRDLEARFRNRDPEGALIEIGRDLVSESRRIYASSGYAFMAAQAGYIDERSRSRVVRWVGAVEYLDLQRREPDEDFGSLYELSKAIVGTPTTLRPLGRRRTAELLYHGYIQTMLKLHVDLGHPLLSPRPRLDDFWALAGGNRRAKLPAPV